METAKRIKADISSNQYFGGMNRRFDKRAAKLRKAGFKYVRIEELNIAVFTKKRLTGKPQTLAASFVLAADNRTFIEEFARSRFC